MKIKNIFFITLATFTLNLPILVKADYILANKNGTPGATSNCPLVPDQCSKDDTGCTTYYVQICNDNDQSSEFATNVNETYYNVYRAGPEDTNRCKGSGIPFAVQPGECLQYDFDGKFADQTHERKQGGIDDRLTVHVNYNGEGKEFDSGSDNEQLCSQESCDGSRFLCIRFKVHNADPKLGRAPFSG
jgi:hypothetical protein